MTTQHSISLPAMGTWYRWTGGHKPILIKVYDIKVNTYLVERKPVTDILVVTHYGPRIVFRTMDHFVAVL